MLIWKTFGSNKMTLRATTANEIINKLKEIFGELVI